MSIAKVSTATLRLARLARLAIERRRFIGVLAAAMLCQAADAQFTPLGTAPSQLRFGGSAAVGTSFLPPLSATGGGASVASPLTFTLTPVGNLADMIAGNQGGAAQTLAGQVAGGFVQAANLWRRIFRDPINIELDIDFGPIGNGILGGADANFGAVTYSDARTTLNLDVTSPFDTLAVANLQPGPAVQFITNDTSFNNAPNASPRIRDNDTVGLAANNNLYLGITTANGKALGFSVPAGADANISFTDFSDFASPFPTYLAWDFDAADGIAANSIDFVGVAVHEIGHAMGFISGVDFVDFFGSPNGAGRPLDLDPYAVYTVLDMFRYSNNSLSQPAQPAGGLNDLAFGEVPGDTPFYSLDGGSTNVGTFSTGQANGNGRQASHWEDNMGLGIMDPTFTIGQAGIVTLLDVVALDVIGYDLVPEPGTIALISIGMAAVLGRRKRCASRC